MKKKLNQVAEFVDKHKTAIVMTEVVVIGAMLGTPKVVTAVKNYRLLQHNVRHLALAMEGVYDLSSNSYNILEGVEETVNAIHGLVEQIDAR